MNKLCTRLSTDTDTVRLCDPERAIGSHCCGNSSQCPCKSVLCGYHAQFTRRTAEGVATTCAVCEPTYTYHHLSMPFKAIPEL